MTLPKPMSARSRYISPKVEIVEISVTQIASMMMPVTSKRMAPTRRIAKPPSRIIGALSQNAVTMPLVEARSQWNSWVSGGTNSTKQ